MNTVTSFGSSPSLEDLKLPGNRRCGDVGQGELYGQLAKLIPGFNHHWGKNDALAAYSRRLQEIHDEAGKAAVAQFLESHRSV